jgi:hypothetical protein
MGYNPEGPRPFYGNPRKLIYDRWGNRRFLRRRKDGTYMDNVDVVRSIRMDRQRQAKTWAPGGFRDQGDGSMELLANLLGAEDETGTERGTLASHLIDTPLHHAGLEQIARGLDVDWLDGNVNNPMMSMALWNLYDYYDSDTGQPLNAEDVSMAESFKDWAEEEDEEHGDISFDKWIREEMEEPTHESNPPDSLTFLKWAGKERKGHTFEASINNVEDPAYDQSYSITWSE